MQESAGVRARSDDITDDGHLRHEVLERQREPEADEPQRGVA